MDIIEQEDLALDNAKAAMDQWEGILQDVIRGLRAETALNQPAIDRTTHKLYAVARDRRALRADDMGAVIASQRRYAALIANYRRFQLEPDHPMLDTTERLATFETAQETLGMLISMRSGWIADEEAKPEPDLTSIAEWSGERDAFVDQEFSLRFTDTESIARVLKTYGPIVRAHFAAQ